MDTSGHLVVFGLTVGHLISVRYICKQNFCPKESGCRKLYVFVGKSKGLWFPYQGFSQGPFNNLSYHGHLKQHGIYYGIGVKWESFLYVS